MPTLMAALAVRTPSAGADPASAAAFWPFQPLKRIAVPAVNNTAWTSNPIDRFILAKLEAKGLMPNPAADRRALIRRVTFDLTGLPPAPEEIEEFVKTIRLKRTRS